METFELSIFTYACHQGAIIGVFSLVSLCVDRILKICGKIKCVTLGLTLSSASIATLSVTTILWSYSPFLVTLFMMIFCVGFALCYPIIFTFSLEIFPKIKGFSSSLTMALRALLCTLMVGVTSFFYNGHPFSVVSIILFAMIFITIIIKNYLLKHFKDEI